MKRIVLGIVSVLLLGSLFASPAQAQNMNNFTIEQFEADFYLSQDGEGRSQLKTVEKITAEFPNFDQNHGLERAIPKKYDDHSTNLKIESVTDENGQSLPYSDHTSNDNLVLRIGDADEYVHGEQTYVITYTQRDVTRYFANTNDDEFYWDINGTQWNVPIKQLSARVHIAQSLSDQLTGQASCYQGAAGSTTQCQLRREQENGGVLIAAEANNLAAHETATVAVGFEPHTFTPYQPSWQERLAVVWLVVAMVSAIGAVVIIVWTSIKYARILRQAKGRPAIIPEYLPPKNTSVLVSAQVIKNSTADITAQLVDLAVRHFLKIYQTKEKTMWGKLAEYELEIVKRLDDLLPEEKGLLQDLFGTNLKQGDRFVMKKLQKEYSLRKKLLERRKSVRKQVRGDYGMFEQAAKEAGWFRRFGVIVLIVGVVLLSPVVVIAAIVLFVFASTLWPLTEKGAELRDYLEGLKLYIKVAEKERLKMLQSPEGAEKVGKIDKEKPGQLVKLYERVLPYAVLFGQEKDWAKQLGVYYETAHDQPDWYVGYGAFNAVVFSSAVSGFSSASSSYSSSSSASTGGAGGGGSAGGGGGGGGGGGW